MTPPDLLRRTGAEALGAFALVFAGCGAIVTNAHTQGALGAVGVSLVFGLVILAGIAALGHVSGAHFNPAVTLSFFLTRHLPGREGLAYVGGQLLGATLAALLLWAIWPGQPADLGATVPSISAARAVIVEAVMSGLLMLVILSVATDTRAVGAPAALAIGATIALDALFGGPLTGASMNPARSFAPALVSGQWRDFWVYLAGPFVGAPLGAFAYQFVRGEHPGLASATAATEEA
jgi:MIP family channel proteins